MTICISAICEHNKKEIFVIATDHMIDVGIGQFEHDIRKHKKINGKIIAMLSGKALLFNELIKEVKAGSTFTKTKETIFNNFLKVKKTCVERELLNKFGLKEKEVGDIVKGEIHNPIIAKMIEAMAKFQLETSILLVGFESGKTKIAEIRETGYADFDDIHFHAIGSGQIQAINTLLFQRHSKCDALETTIYNVYKAKRNAEVASGVGIETDMLIMNENGCHDLDKEDLNKLSEIYEKELEFGKTEKGLKKLDILNKMNSNIKGGCKSC